MRQKSPKLIELDKRMGVRWRKVRKARGLKHDELVVLLAAKDYICHKSVINRLENGRSQPEHFQVFIMIMCYIYHISPNELFGNEAQFYRRLEEIVRIRKKLKEAKCQKKDS